MQAHTRDRLRSRKKEVDDYVPCELCRRDPVVDVHHLDWWMGKRKHRRDWSDL